ncbi:hypothetical protein [Paenibacillus apiarius]|uniref:hypothetical protein n=1 Tax=Paenibacillus apiarius TaxID=46240 RepID=UPI001980932B|nr:hypothetical protein [Paenibacillus apiarius]MBN3524084.1 hypothetical protein [Paenibacillus apiarius]
MSNRIPQPDHDMMKALLQRYKGTGKQIELITEKGAYAMQASKDSSNFVIEIVEDSEVIEVDGVGSTEELRAVVQGAVRETISNATGRM